MPSIEDKIREKLNFNINNLWLGNKIEEVVIDPTVGPEDDTLTLTMRTMTITFETLYKNIASYPNIINLSNENRLVKTYYLENDKQIVIETLVENNGDVMKTTISGDTELPYPVMRIKTLYGDVIKTIYQEVK